MEVKDKKIAFFDSGVGGLTVFSEIKKQLPNENYIYFGDLKNSPYGEKTKEQLVDISKKIFDFFEKQDVKAVVMACNTTSANVFEKLRNNYNFKIYPIIQSCAEEISKFNVKKICVFATEATVNSHAYRKYINSFNKNIEIKEIACPEWVKIVEENKINDADSLELIEKYMREALKFMPEKIILGCTHYPFLTDILSKFASKDLFLNPSKIFVQYIKNDLSKNLMLKDSPDGQESFFVSANPESFRHAGSMFYELKKNPQKIDFS